MQTIGSRRNINKFRDLFVYIPTVLPFTGSAQAQWRLQDVCDRHPCFSIPSPQQDGLIRLLRKFLIPSTLLHRSPYHLPIAKNGRDVYIQGLQPWLQGIPPSICILNAAATELTGAVLFSSKTARGAVWYSLRQRIWEAAGCRRHIVWVGKDLKDVLNEIK